MSSGSFRIPVVSSKIGGKEVYVLEKKDLDYIKKMVEIANHKACSAIAIAEHTADTVECCYPGTLATREEILAEAGCIDPLAQCCG